jgi:hypothetical protein
MEAPVSSGSKGDSEENYRIRLQTEIRDGNKEQAARHGIHTKHCRHPSVFSKPL